MQTTIVLKGILSNKWEAKFPDLQFDFKDECTILSGEIKDNASLHGVLNKIRNLNLDILSLNNIYTK